MWLRLRLFQQVWSASPRPSSGVLVQKLHHSCQSLQWLGHSLARARGCRSSGMMWSWGKLLQSRIQWLGPHSRWLQVQDQLSLLVVISSVSVSPCRPVIQNQGRKRRRSVSALCFGGRKSSVPGAAWAGSPVFFWRAWILNMIPIWFAEDAIQPPLVLVKHHLWGAWMLAAQWTDAAAVQTCCS